MNGRFSDLLVLLRTRSESLDSPGRYKLLRRRIGHYGLEAVIGQLNSGRTTRDDRQRQQRAQTY